MAEKYRVLKTESLSAAYFAGDLDVISDVSFEMAPGEIVCIVGESGSGKSTLIKAIHGMSGVVTTGGRIFFDGMDLGGVKMAEKRRLMGTEIGLIPQNPAASFNPIRRYDVQFREALAGHDMEFNEAEVVGVMRRIGLTDGRAIMRRRPYELSGGMNQRVAIAAAMMLRPKLLMCDEATSALDVTTAGAVVRELMKIRDKSETAILMVTHHLGIAKMMADNIGIMQSGRIVEYGSRDQIFRSPQNEYTCKLIRDVPRLRR